SAQERLAKTSVRVRMGLHTGEALLVDGRYVGMDVHRAARVGAAGHGAQVLLSPATVALLEPESFQLRDLGQHRLKDLSDPIRLYQLGTTDFPPLKTLHRTNLPVPATPFLGRTRELATVIRHAADPSVQLLTLTGPGGTGKTRLALQAAGELAEQFPGGVFWVPLAPLRDSRLVASAITEALGFEHEGDDDSIDSIASAIDSRTLLLVDNCEHLLDGVAAVVRKSVRVMPTSASAPCGRRFHGATICSVPRSKGSFDGCLFSPAEAHSTPSRQSQMQMSTTSPRSVRRASCG